MVSLNRDGLTGKVLAGERIFCGRGARIVSLAARRGGSAGQMRGAIWQRRKVTPDVDARSSPTLSIETSITRTFAMFTANSARFYRTEKDEDHYVLSFEQIDQKLDELSSVGGVQILMQGGGITRIAVRMVYRSAGSHSGKIFRTSIFTVQSAGVSTFRRDFRMPLREVISEFRKAGLGSIPGGGREEENSGGSGAKKKYRH